MRMTIEEAVVLFDRCQYQQAFEGFASIYNESQNNQERQDIMSILQDAYYVPNIEELQENYEKNCSALSEYPYFDDKQFANFSDLSFLLFPTSDDTYYIYDKQTDRFIGKYNSTTCQQIEQVPEKIDPPIVLEDEDNFYKLKFLSEYVQQNNSKTADKYIYLLYHTWQPLQRIMQVGDLSSILEHKNFIFLMGKENHRRCSVDYKDMQSIEEINPFDELTEFVPYIQFLKQNLEKYLVFIVACDTPAGPGMTRQYAAMLQTLGLKADLYRKYRCGYVAIIDAGRVVIEQLSPPGQEIKRAGKFREIAVNLISKGFNHPPVEGLIELDGKNYSSNSRGLNFVICDFKQKKVVNSINFDCYTEGMPCRDGVKFKLKKWHKKHPEIALFCLKNPVFPKINRSELESHILKCVGVRPSFETVCNDPLSPLHEYCKDKTEIAEILHTPKSYINHNGIRQFENYQGKYLHTINGHRLTLEQPSNPQRTIYMVGGCGVFGYGVRDEGTIASQLQKICNKNASQQEFIVENYGYYLCEADYTAQEEMHILESLPLKAGDIVIANFGYSDDIPILDLSNESQRPHSYGELFFDTGHLCENGCRVVAKKIFEYLQENSFFEVSKDLQTLSWTAKRSSQEQNPELAKYQAALRGFYNDHFSVGAIVMNCNPFTLGHRYLIDQACRQCGHLIIFVVEEDRSVFPFPDRLQLVIEGTKDLSNVTVMPSGQFILSSLTFSEYFNKSQLQERVVDPSADINLFAKDIAPCLHITKRFVGTEPQDTVTNQYNLEMKKILPKYGIELIEINRMLQKNGDTVISASTVRKYMEEGNLAAIQDIVPISTYQYIVEHLDSLVKKIHDIT